MKRKEEARKVLNDRLLEAGVPALVKCSEESSVIRVILGDSATALEADRAKQIAERAASELGRYVIVS